MIWLTILILIAGAALIKLGALSVNMHQPANFSKKITRGQESGKV